MAPSDGHGAENGTPYDERPLLERSGDEGPEASTASSPRMHVGDDSPVSPNGHLPLPVWLRESSNTFHWGWVPLRLRKAARSVAAWSKGPDPPQIQKIHPFFPSIQEAPVKFIDTYFPRTIYKAGLLAFFYFLWLLTFSLVLNHSARAGYIKGYGKPSPIWCGASYWAAGNRCGLNGNDCRPFDNAAFAFRCPANCRGTRVLNPHAVGQQEILYRQLVIGGPNQDSQNQSVSEPIYRGDSFVCVAAIHAGVISNARGGCGVVQLTGEQDSFPSSTKHGVESISFDSSFPKSYRFVTGLSSKCVKDLRWPLLAVTVGFTTILSLCTKSPVVFFCSIFVMLFFHVGLVSDPPTNSDYVSLSSLIIGRFLPAAFVAFVIYRFSVKPQLTGLTAHVEKTILWLGGAWLGGLNNYTFDHIPIDRLTPHDLKAEPGAPLALIIVVLVLFTIALGQVWYLRLEGRFRRYLAIYGIFVAFLIICVIVPRLNLRIHHYFLAILLLPGTRLQTRPSLLYQGILVGLFINGIARWGFDSILQTTAELRRDGPHLTLLPNITAPVLGSSNITFSWSKPPAEYDGLSVLVNDVERHRWYYGEGDPSHTFARHHEGEREYFRFGYMKGSQSEDFTKAGVWEIDGSWTTMEPGAS
ncbi:MAG: hypothetical protein Q9191_007558 [Dirinaria sp. TL-2023a]